MKMGNLLVENVRVILLNNLSHDVINGNNLLLQLGISVHVGGKTMDIGNENNIYHFTELIS